MVCPYSTYLFTRRAVALILWVWGQFVLLNSSYFVERLIIFSSESVTDIFRVNVPIEDDGWLEETKDKLRSDYAAVWHIDMTERRGCTAKMEDVLLVRVCIIIAKQVWILFLFRTPVVPLWPSLTFAGAIELQSHDPKWKFDHRGVKKRLRWRMFRSRDWKSADHIGIGYLG